MRVVFRADASRRIGSGHVARCVTLGQELARRGAKVTFIARQHESGWYRRVADAGFELRLLQTPSGHRSDLPDGDYVAWLGVDPLQDAAETIEHLAEQDFDLLIVDHYALDAAWEREVRAHVGRVMAIDDLADRVHEVDLLLDQNLRSDGGAVYRQLLPGGAAVLSGPSYALLAPSYRRTREQSAPAAQPGRVLVSLGGATAPDVLNEVMAGLCDSSGAVSAIDVVDPLRAWGGDGQQACHRAGVPVQVHGAVPDLVGLLLDAEVAVGAGGSTSWERMCLGVPTVAVSVASNQRRVLNELDKVGTVIDVGDVTDGAAGRCGDGVDALLRDRARRETMGCYGRLLVDGRGVERVAEAIVPTTTGLELRDAHDDDAGLFWLWANSPEVRQQSVSQDPIDWRDHLAWFTARLADRSTWMFMLEADALPVGQIRFDVNDRVAVVDYSLDACVRGRGWGKALVELGIARLVARSGDHIEEIRADVKPQNAASVRVFEGAGFDRVPASSRDDPLVTFVRSAKSTSGGEQWRGWELRDVR